MKALALALVISACTPADWRTQDQGMEGISLTLLATDWGQTVQDVTTSCNEGNPIIGECGQRVSPNVYFPVVMVTSMVISRLLPPYYRDVFQGALIGAEMTTVQSNWRKY